MSADPIRLELLGGDHVRDAVAQARALAQDTGSAVVFDFNGTEHEARPDDTPESAKARAEERLGHPIRTAEEEAEEARRSLETMRSEQAADIAAASALTEQQMRDADVPWLKTPEELAAYIATLVDRPHDYGTCVYAMSMAAVAAYRYVGGTLGVTGFQASCADADFVKRVRRYEHGFRFVDYGKLLYPQYLTAEHFPSWEDLLDGESDLHRHLAGEAKRLLAEPHGAAHVRDHLRWIMETAPAEDTAVEAPR